MRKLCFTTLICLLSFTMARAHRPVASIPATIELRNEWNGHSRTVGDTEDYREMVTMASQEEEELPFDNDTWFGYLMNWVMKILLWAIYLSLLGMVLAVTWWFLTAKGFWSWVVAMMGAFFYAMWLGRYWGYTLCIILFVLLFAALKLYLSGKPQPKIVRKRKGAKG